MDGSCTNELLLSTAIRSIPIISKLDYTDPAYLLRNRSCGIGETSWNTVASSPFAKEASVNSWEELPDLLHDLLQKSDEYINKLQVIRLHS